MNKKKILLIEDDEIIRENTAEILELAHYEVTTAENGKIGVKMAGKTIPDLIICDIMMPELDGYGVLFLLGKDPVTSTIPFIFLTAKTERKDMRKGMAMGADDYLTKPFEEMDLLHAVEGRLKRSQVFKQAFSRDVAGFNLFINEARALQELHELSQDRRTRTYKKKEVIFYEGDHAHALYFLSRGKVKLYKVHDDGKEYITGLVKEGEFFGYMPILKNQPFDTFACAMEDSEVRKIPKEDFLVLIRRNRDVAGRFIKMISNNLIEKEELLLSLAYDSVRKRVANALIALKNRFDAGSASPFKTDISRSDLASMAGTAPESVIRTLSDFKNEELIQVKGKEIVVLNASGLEKVW